MDSDASDCYSLLGCRSDDEDEMYISEDEGEASSRRTFFAMCVTLSSALPACRGTTVARQRIEWESFVTALERESPHAVQRMYRMPLCHVRRLGAMLEPLLRRPYAEGGYGGSQSLDVFIILHCTLRWLSGGSYLDIFSTVGIAVATFYKAVHAGLRAINDCEELQLRWPRTSDEIAEAAANFRACSTNSFMTGCVGATDGWLCHIVTPAAHECAYN
eukprot:GHVU01068805.1.p1 GENE.GHVU01068805.1~~GHVU01068805.1.p1  ORF type:complete len:217 (-),score=17.47 GHVU01068805.1:259-909(-)